MDGAGDGRTVSCVRPAELSSGTEIRAPGSTSEQEALENGCWAKLYGKKNFGGVCFTLTGPVELGRMVGPLGVN